jgi:predicted MFS family arabinose efflux permease
MVFAGYAINMFAVPALALAGNWPVAAALMIAERTGRAIRKPSVETLISYSGKEIGQGWVFGLNEALDQLGATVGPLIVALVLFLKGSYKDGYAVLLISALLCIGTLIVARLLFPKPEELEKKVATPLETKGFPKTYWLYVVAGALIAAGFVDFSLIAFHFQKTGSVTGEFIPISYAMAMAIAGISALIFGRLLDRVGYTIIIIAFFLSAFFAPFVFLGKLFLALVGMVLWGIGMGAQDSLLKASLANIISKEKRSTAFGLFDTSFGFAWFLGSASMGLLYAKSLTGVIVFSVVLQLAALPVFILAARRRNKS